MDAWLPFGASVRGAQHLRTDKPNQDALRWRPEGGNAGGPVTTPVVMSVADGHGGNRNFRSDSGSAFAVQAGTQVLWRFVDKAQNSDNLLATKRLAEEMVPRQIEKEWRRLVDEDLERRPLTADESGSLRSDPSSVAAGAGAGIASSLSRAQERSAYGTTLLASAIASDFLLHLQIGDGDLLMVSEGGEVLRPIPQDPGLVGEQTLSLSREGSWQDFHLVFFARVRASPAMILLSTDGLSKSFPRDEDFRGFARDLLGSIRKEGARHVSEGLPKVLEQTTRDGSGDDITLGLMVRPEEHGGATPGPTVPQSAEVKA